MGKTTSKLIPFLFYILSGIIVGLIIFNAYASKAISYISDAPETCINCHIMTPQYTTWNHSSHKTAATCNDCHVPHNNIFNHYRFKAKDGLRHATIFTLRKEPQVIRIREEGKKVVQDNCIRCHLPLITDEKLKQKTGHFHKTRKEKTCWDCHRATPHGTVNSLSSVPFARAPLPENITPAFFKK